MNMKKIDGDYKVNQSNLLIEKKKYLSTEEMKIIIIFASLIEPDDENFKLYEIKAQDIMKFLKVKNKSHFKILKDALYNLASKSIKRETEDSFEILNWFDYAKYENGVLKVEFNRRLKPYLLQLKEHFTTYKLNNIALLKSKYSIQLYEFLKCNQYKNKIEISIDELRDYLNTKNSYKAYKDFKRATILKAQKELHETTDISFDFNEIKKGRKVIAVRFTVKSNKAISAEDEICADKISDNNQKNSYEKYINEINFIKMLLDNEITDKEALIILQAAEFDINKVKEKYKYISTKECKNQVAYLMSAIKEDYKPNKKKDKPSNFCNYDQREYDFNKLEKQLLGLDEH